MIDPMGNDTIRTAMIMMYGPILDAYRERRNSPVAILLRCLTCVVFHIDHFIFFLKNFQGHFISKIPIIHNKDKIKN